MISDRGSFVVFDTVLLSNFVRSAEDGPYRRFAFVVLALRFDQNIAFAFHEAVVVPFQRRGLSLVGDFPRVSESANESCGSSIVGSETPTRRSLECYDRPKVPI